MLWWRWRSAFLSALLLFSCWCAFPQAVAPPSYAQRPNDLIQSLRLRLWNIDKQLVNLEAELSNWKALLNESEQRSNDLALELTKLKEEILNLSLSLDGSQSQVVDLQRSLKASEAKYEVVYEKLKSSADLWEAAFNAEHMRVKRGKIGTTIGIIAAIMVGGIVGYAIHN